MAGTPPSREAEELFLRWVEGREAVAEEDLELLCAEHPDLAEELREFCVAWRWIEEVVEVDEDLLDDEGCPAVRFSDERYNLLDQIGAGGMGVVYDAWDTRFKRHLAMKVLAGRGSGSPRHGRSSRSALRFLEEAQIMGQLDHPGVLPIHDLGVNAEGRLFFTMRRVEGHDFKTVLDMVRAKSEGWSVTRALGVVARVCDTLAYAHSKGVIHRDLKPANIMVGRFGQTYVVDWGLARVRGHEDTQADAIREALSSCGTALVTERTEHAESDSYPSLLTAEGAVVGTPTYMAPEQARGELEEVGARADVYAIGAVLYHLISGRPPYAKQASGGAQAVLREVIRTSPEPLERAASGAPEELVAICEKAMARDLEHRYPTMEMLANDVRAYLEHRVVAAHRSGAIVEMRKWLRRNRVAAASITAAGILFVAAAVAVVWIETTKGAELRRTNEDLEAANARIAEESERAKANEQDALAERDRADRQAYASKMAAAQAEFELNRVDFARQVLMECADELRGWEWDHLYRHLDESAGELVDADTEDDGRFTRVIPLPEDHVATLHRNGALRVWDVDSREAVIRVEIGARGYALGRTPDARRLITGDFRGFVKVWDPASGELLASKKLHHGGFDGYVFSLDVSPSGDLVASAATDGTVVISSLEDLSPERALQAGERAYYVRFSPDGRAFATTSDDNVLRLWDTESGDLTLERAIDEPEARSIASWPIDFSPDGGRIAWGGTDGAARIFDLVEQRVVRVLTGHDQRPISLEFDPSGKRLVSGSSDRTIRVWDTSTAECLLVGRGHRDRVADVTFTEDGSTIVSVGEAAKVWTTTRRAGGFVLDCPADVDELSISPDGRRLVTGGRDRWVLVWDLESGVVLRRLGRAESWCRAVHWSPATQVIAAAFQNGRITLWDADALEELRSFRGDASIVHGVSFDPSGRLLATASANGAVRLWEAGTGSMLSEHDAGLGAALHVVWSPDGTQFVSGHERGSLVVHDSSGSVIRTVEANSRRIRAGAFDPSGTRFASGGADGDITTWDVGTWTRIRAWNSHAQAVWSLSFSPDGTRLASAAEDDSGKLWDPESGEQVLLTLAPRWMVDVEFSADGELLLYASMNRLIGLRRSPELRDVAAHRRAKDRMRPYVQALLHELWQLSAMTERIESDPKLSAGDRAAAIELAQLAHRDTAALAGEAHEALHGAGKTREDYEEGLKKALAMAELRAPSRWIDAILAAGYARTGQPEKALEWSRRSREKFRRADEAPRPSIPAFEALAELALDRPAEARRLHEEARSQAIGTKWEQDEDLQALLEEIGASLRAAARGTEKSAGFDSGPGGGKD